jgi:hypothetical protein
LVFIINKFLGIERFCILPTDFFFYKIYFICGKNKE